MCIGWFITKPRSCSIITYLILYSIPHKHHPNKDITFFQLNHILLLHQVLDIGIGTASALSTEENVAIMRKKCLKFVGVDYNDVYIAKAKNVVLDAGIGDRVSLHCLSVYEDTLVEEIGCGFDSVYFSGSFSLMPDPGSALKKVAKLLKPGKGGLIYITQTYQRKSFPLLGVLKPLTKYLTTIDFGSLVMEHEIVSTVESAGMKILENSVIPGSVDNAMQVARILVIDPYPCN